MGDKRPYLRPVTRVEVSQKNTTLRWIALVVLLAIAVTAFATGMKEALSVQPGWEEVTVQTREPSCAGDFKLMYDFSQTGGSAAVVNKSLIQCYEDSAVRAYQLLSSEVTGLDNMALLNSQVNQPVTVAPELYELLSQVARSGNRQLFLTPARVEYNRVFLCEQEAEAAQYDPNQNPEVKSWLSALSLFVSDPAHIALEILGEHQVMLKVSPAYLSFAQENGIEVFADFGWMRNAFAADLIAQDLVENGFTTGYLASFDGFTRNLDTRGGDYTMNLFDRQGVEIQMPARVHYSGPASLVSLRDYPMTDRDRWNYFGFSNGTILTSMLDPKDCMSKSALHNLVLYSSDRGCAELVLEAAELFAADLFREEDLLALASENIYGIWPQGRTLHCNAPDLSLELLAEGGQGYEVILK